MPPDQRPAPGPPEGAWRARPLWPEADGPGEGRGMRCMECGARFGDVPELEAHHLRRHDVPRGV